VKKSEVSSAVSTTFSLPAAAEEVGLSRPTVDAWIKSGMIEPTGQHNGRPAFSLADLEDLRRIKRERDEAREMLSLKITKPSTGR